MLAFGLPPSLCSPCEFRSGMAASFQPGLHIALKGTVCLSYFFVAMCILQATEPSNDTCTTVLISHVRMVVMALNSVS